MGSETTNPGDLLLGFGPGVARVLQRQFPSLPEDVIDDMVAEAVARAWRRIQSAPRSQDEGRSLFALVLTIAINRAIDHLRYSPRVQVVSPEILDRLLTQPTARESSSRLAQDLEAAIAELSPLDGRILQAAMAPPSSGNWAQELALELLREDISAAGSTPREVDKTALERHAGKLRVRKLRIIDKLRQSLRSKGYTIPQRGAT